MAQVLISCFVFLKKKTDYRAPNPISNGKFKLNQVF